MTLPLAVHVVLGSLGAAALYAVSDWMTCRRQPDRVREDVRSVWTAGLALVLGMGAAIGAYAAHSGTDAWTVAAAAVVLVPAAIVDARIRRIPNEWMVLGAVLGCLGAALNGGAWGVAVEALGPAAGVAVGLLLIREGSRAVLGEPGLGMGDVKLGIVLACLLGWEAVWVLYIATVGSALFGVAGRLTGRLSARSRIPFAPFVAGSAALCLLVVPFSVVLDAYLTWIGLAV